MAAVEETGDARKATEKCQRSRVRCTVPLSRPRIALLPHQVKCIRRVDSLDPAQEDSRALSSNDEPFSLRG